jgi:hypothetical protein
MTGNAINAKSEAPQLHELSSEDELSSEELDAVCGGLRDDAHQQFQNMLNAVSS